MVRAYQQVCSEVISRFDGHIAQLLGDGLLVYFGYPQAHEDDAQRAVGTGLGILAAMGDLNTRLQREKEISLAVRLGIHTGLVVVGAMGGQGRQEQLALGEVPNIASRDVVGPLFRQHEEESVESTGAPHHPLASGFSTFLLSLS